MNHHLRRSDEVNELYRKFAEEDKAQTQEDYRELLQLPALGLGNFVTGQHPGRNTKTQPQDEGSK